MCLDLQKITGPEGDAIEVPCRNCRRCAANKLTAIAGQVYAECLTATAFYCLTLTYGGDQREQGNSPRQLNPRSQTLFYEDVQLLFKSLRNDGYKPRYYIAGEYGGKRGRAHWHMVIAFRGPAPKFPPPDIEQQTWDYWPHGYTFVQKPDYFGLLYVMKYVAKDDGSDRTTRYPQMSKKPVLGYYYWRELASLRIDHGLPFSRKFTLPGANYKNGQPVEYFLRNASFREAYKAHRAEWHRRGNLDEPPVALDDWEYLRRSLLRGAYAKPGVNRYNPLDRFPLIDHPCFDRGVICTPGFALVRFKDGHVWAVQNSKRGFLLWLVPDVRTMLACARGRRVSLGQPVRLRTNLPPF